MAWQEAVHKDIEHAFGVLQRKFHIIVKPIEMWYVTDISSVINTCLILYNMMVAKRMEDGEMESKAFYTFGSEDGDGYTTSGTHKEPEQLHVNHRDAKMHLHRQLNQSNSIVCEEQDKGVIDSLCFHYTHQ